MVEKKTTERGILFLSLNNVLEELVVIPREGKKKNQREKGLKAAEMKQAQFSGTTYISEYWPVCTWYPGWRVSRISQPLNETRLFPEANISTTLITFYTRWIILCCDLQVTVRLGPDSLPTIHFLLSTNSISLTKFTEVVLCVIFHNPVAMVQRNDNSLVVWKIMWLYYIFM